MRWTYAKSAASITRSCGRGGLANSDAESVWRCVGQSKVSISRLQTEQPNYGARHDRRRLDERLVCTYKHETDEQTNKHKKHKYTSCVAQHSVVF